MLHSKIEAAAAAASRSDAKSSDASATPHVEPLSPLAVPAGAIATTMQRALAEFADLEPTLLSSSPFVLQLDRFASADEIDAVLQLGEATGYQGSQLQEGSSGAARAWRTSESATAGTPLDSAAQSAQLAALFNRIANLTLVPLENFEPTQLVRYQPGQYYKFHTDCSQETGTRTHRLSLTRFDPEANFG